MKLFDPKISAGNVLTIIGGCIVAAGLYATDKAAEARAQEKMASLQVRVMVNERKVEQIAEVKEQVVQIRTNQENQKELIIRILDNVEGRR